MNMTEQEAIKIIKNEKFWEGNERICEAFEMAIHALEKQTPKQPIYAQDKHECPLCGKQLKYRELSYCGLCGQKLDWNE